MNLAGIDKHDIMFFELIAAALNAVGYIAVQMMILSDTITMVLSMRTIVSGVMPTEHILTMIWMI